MPIFFDVRLCGPLLVYSSQKWRNFFFKKSKNINVKNKSIKGNEKDKILKRQHRETALQNEVKLVTEMMQ